MGDPKKSKKKYNTPAHPWIKEKIEEEKILTREYGLKNKREIWKMESKLKNYKDQAKKLIAIHTEQSKKESQFMLEKLQKYGLIKNTDSLDPVLELTLRDILERRLQTLVFKKGLAHTINQSRQYIVHEHIMVEGKKMTVPSYLVNMKEESLISFSLNSTLHNEEHPERIIVRKEVQVRPDT